MPAMYHFNALQQVRFGKIWGISSAPNGIVYMAAEKGLVEFDGADWINWKGSAGFTRSIAVSSNDSLYTGSDLDFGIWRRNNAGDFEYQSLYPFGKVIQKRNEEFWHTAVAGDVVAFASKDNIYLYTNGAVSRIAAAGEISGCYAVDNQLYVFIEGRGLFVIKGAELELLAAYQSASPFLMKGLYRHNDKLVLVSQNLGLWEIENKTIQPINTVFSQKLASETVFSFSILPNKLCSFGTIRNGLYCASPDGEVVLHLNKRKGLPNNTILSLHQSKDGRLWLGLDVGCTIVDVMSPSTYVIDYSGNLGTPQTAVLDNGTFYLGTNQGLFSAPWSTLDSRSIFNDFSFIQGSTGQVWTLIKDDNNLLIGHDRGLLLLSPGGLQSLGGEPGVWTITRPNNNYLLTGQYNGIGIFSKSNSKWVYKGKMKDIAGSCSQLLLSGDSVLWIGIPNYGIIRARLNDEFQPTERQIFPDSLFGGRDIQLKQSAEGMLVVQNGLSFRYNKHTKAFEKEGKVSPVASVEGLVNNYAEPIIIDSQYQFFPIYNGFAFHRNTASEPVKLSKPLLRSMVAIEEAISLDSQSLEAIPYQWRNLKVKIALPTYPEAAYRYRLASEDSAWSQWQQSAEIVLLGLTEGQYTLEIMARVHGAESEALIISFSIDPPWYRSWYGYTLYLLVSAALLAFARWRTKNKLLRQRQAMLQKQRQMLQEQAEKHRQKTLLLEQQQLLQEKQQLSEQLKAKTIELASKAKDNTEKAHLLEKIKTTFEEGLANPGRAHVKWTEMQRLLESNTQEEDRVFQMQMDELHQEFFKNLKSQFEGLSVYDLRLCAYLKIGLSSAEIAELLKVQPSSVYISRSRLRKKLKLSAEEDLFNFLNDI